MIIRLTVNDNDFQKELRNYLNQFDWYIRELAPEFEKEISFTCESLRNWRQRDKEVSRLFNPNSDVVLTDKDKEFIIAQVKRTFGVYCDNNLHQDIATYLKEKLEVTVLNSMSDKWENGEAFYWFQHANKFINQ